jgi:hypothetical protein
VTELVVLTPGQLEAIVASAVERAAANGNDWRALTAAELGERLGFHEKTIQNRSAPGVPEADRIPSHSLTPGGEKRFDLDEVREWLLRRES